MIWKIPPRIKVFEALGSMADGRVAIEVKKNSGQSQNDQIVIAKVSSSDGSKFYTVKYDEANNKISSNDNASKWQGYTGYPIIAVLMKLGKLPFDTDLSQGLKGIAWKAINSKYKNDWDKTEEEIFEGLDRERYNEYAAIVLERIETTKMTR